MNIYLDLISKYRTQLMGIAILWVMFYHSPFAIVSYPVLLQIKNMGYGGVDMFMFLSGIGIYYSLSKNNSIKEFYQRRIWRILPYYIPIVLAYSMFQYLHHDLAFTTVILNVLTLSYWFGLDGHFEWYIPTILVFYLISPFLFRIFVQKNKLVLILVLFCCLLLFYSLGGTKYSYLLLAVGRFPLYLLGFKIGNFLENNKEKKCSKLCILSVLFLFISGLFLWSYLLSHYWPFYWSSDNYGYGLAYVPYWLIILPLCLFISYFLSFFKNYKYPILTFFGGNTLILYIFHERIMNLLIFYNIGNITILGFILTLIVATGWKKIVDWIIQKYFY